MMEVAVGRLTQNLQGIECHYRLLRDEGKITYDEWLIAISVMSDFMAAIDDARTLQATLLLGSKRSPSAREQSSESSGHEHCSGILIREGKKYYTVASTR